MTEHSPESAIDLNTLIGDEPLEIMERDGIRYHILGTAHVSQKSAEVVTALIETDAFDAVAVELCEPRFQALTKQQGYEEMDLFAVLRQGKAGMMMASLALSAYQRRIAKQFGIEPGAEMKAGIEAANKMEKPVWLIDREIGITLKRASAHLGWWGRWVMLNGLFFSMFSKEEISEREIEELKQGDLLGQTLQQVSADSPELYESLIAERDRYMAAKLKIHATEDSAGQQTNQPIRSILVVLGAGHLPGTVKALAQDEVPKDTLTALEYTPPKSHIWKLIPWAILVLVLLGFAIGFSRSPELGWALISTWVLINGGLSALGALIARAHPLTVLTAIFAAPLTSLNPTVGAGMVTGAVEAWLKKPTIGDFDALRDDVSTLKGWYRNKISHVFLVFFLSNLGSAAGTWIAGFSMVRQLTAGS